MLTLNKPPCFYDISSFSRVAVADVEERTILHGTKWSNARVQSNAGAALSFMAMLIQKEPRCLRADVRTGLGLGVSGACARQRALMATEPLKFNNSRTFKVSFLLLGAKSETSMCTSAIFATLMLNL